MDFGKLEIVTKTFDRKAGGATRGQDYKGIKFRRYVSKRKGKEGQLQEVFVIADELFAGLNLTEFALTQANTPEAVLLLVVEDQDKLAPVAKFCRQSVSKKDGAKQDKGKSFSNPYLLNALIAKGTIHPEELGSQFLNIVDAFKEMQNVPAHVKGIFKIVVDTTIDKVAANKAEAATVDNF